MKIFKKAAFAIIGAATLMAPLGLGAIAHAQEVPINFNGIQLGCTHDPDSHGDCDLAVDKQVSVNGGAFVDADTSADAAQAHVGDTITWKIIVTNTSTEGFTPTGTVYVNDVLPSAGVDYVSSSATAGSYITSGFFENDWYLPLLQSDGSDGFVTTLPAILTITSTSTSTGLFENTATLAKYDSGSCDGGCVYSDANPDNDSNDAWIDPSAAPQVLADSSTLANTGGGTVPSIVAVGLMAAALVTGFAGKRSKTDD